MKRRVWLIVGAVAFVLTFKVMLWAFTPAEETGYFDVDGALGEVGPPRVELITRGIEPREPLRLAPEPDSQRRFRWTSTERMRVDAVGEGLADTELEVVLEVRGRIREVYEDGSFDWSWKVTGVEVPRAESHGELANPEQRRLAEGLKGLRGRSLIDDRGFVLHSSLDAGGRGSNRELRQVIAVALGEPAVHLPEQPVGERAIWEVHRTVVRQGIEMESTERYELMRRHKGDLEVRAKGTATAGAQEVDAFFGDVLRTELTSYRASGGGDWTFSLDGALQATGQGWRDEELDVEQSFQGLPIQVGLESHSETSLEAVE